MTRTKMLFALAVGFVLLATPAWADFKMERRLALEPGGTFTLNADIGSVTLTGDSTSGATVTVTSRRDDFDELFDLRFDESPAGVTVTSSGGAAGSRASGAATGLATTRSSSFACRRRRPPASERPEARSMPHGSAAVLLCTRRAAVCAPKRSTALSRGRPVAARSRCAT